MITLAHYWGIDEVGIYVVPILLAIASLWWMEKRARRSAEEREREDAESDDSENYREPLVQSKVELLVSTH